MFDLRRSDVALLQAVSDYGSLHGAQRHGRVTQSSASRRLDVLERQLHTRLVARGATGAQLTDAGHALLYVGRRLLGSIDFAMAAADHDGASGPHLRVLQFALSTEYAVEFGQGLAARFPGVVFDLVTTSQSDAWSRFDRYAVDVACGWARFSPPTRRQGAVVTTVLEEPQWVALPCDHALAHRPSLSLHELARTERVAVVGENALAGPAQASALHNWAPRIRCTVHSESAARDLVARGYGFALVSPLSGHPHGDEGLVLRPLRQQLVRRLVLASDPLLPKTLAHDLCTWLRHRYVHLAAERHPGYLRSVTFPLPAAELLRTAPVPRGTGPRLAALGELPLLISERHWTAEGASSLVEAEHLRLLRVIERTGSLNRAASELLVTQPALSRRIRRLERICGQTLVHSAPRGTSLSARARRLLHCTKAAEERLDALVAALRQSAFPVRPPAVRHQSLARRPDPSKRLSSAMLVSSTDRC